MASLRTILPAFRGFRPQRWHNELPYWQRCTSSTAVTKLESRRLRKLPRLVLTLKPEKMVLAGQETINFSNLPRVGVTARNVSVQITFRNLIPFPPRTTGVLYFRHLPGSPLDSQLRIRLCESVEHFAHGSDLLSKAGHPWNIGLHRMKTSEPTYQPLLDIIQDEFGDIPYGNPITTLSPEEMVSAGQLVFDVSGRHLLTCRIHTGKSSGRSAIFNYYASHPFPPNTRGVLYSTLNNKELRFRLCSTVEDFHGGSDLLLPNGKPWGGAKIQQIIAPMGSEAKPPTKSYILSLLPNNIISSGQKVLNMPATSRLHLWVRNRDDFGELIWHHVLISWYSNNISCKGVFYWHHVPGDDKQSQLRFRVCSTTAEFGDGEDALRETGTIWNRPLSILRRYPAYQPILNLIREECGLLESATGSPPKTKGKHPLLPIASLSPQKLIPLKQQILNISGLHDVFLNAAPTVKGRRKTTIRVEDSTSGADPSDNVAFPPDTLGIFYYKQSLTSPTQVGELRFRLCRHLAFFDRSEDLTFSTGDPWYIDVQQLCLNEQYRAMRDTLIREGLVELNPHLVDPVDPQLRSQEDAHILSNLFQPFALELSREQHKFWVQADENTWVMLNIAGLFSPTENKYAFNGRIVARFEPYPQEVGNLPNTKQHRPLLALRFLEILAPLQRISNEDFMKRPVPGQLHMVCPPSVAGTPSEYRPWGFRNSDPKNRKILLGLLQREAAKNA